MEISEAKKSAQRLLQYEETPAQAPPKLLQECISFINKKFKALCLVSVGGEGIILKVLDETNQKVCIKICKAALCSEASRKSHDAIIYNVINFMRKTDLKNIPEERFKAGTILQRNLYKELVQIRNINISVPQIYDLRSEPFLFVSMEWVEHPGLIRFLVEKSSMIIALGTFKKILSGVSFLHERGILHRDWKSDNIFVDEKENPIVVDWTLAKELGDRNITIPGTMGGTPGFAPEKFIEEKNFKAANYLDDIYQLGFLFWEVCCQQRLPKIKVENCTVKHIENFRKDLVEYLPDACQPVFWRATERLEKDRYQNVIEFQERIKELIEIFSEEKEYIPRVRAPEIIEQKTDEIIIDTDVTDIYECENCGKCNGNFPCKNFRKSIIDIVLEMKKKGII